MIVFEALRSIRASASTTLAATMTVLIGMFLLGVLIALGTWVVSWSAHVKKEVIVKVYFTQDASAAQINSVAAKLDRDPRVKKYTFVSKDEALARMKKRYPDLFKAGALPSNPLPASEEVERKKAEYADAIYRSFTRWCTPHAARRGPGGPPRARSRACASCPPSRGRA